MKRLIQTSFFEVLSSQVSTESQVRIATERLLEEIVALSISEPDSASLFRTLHYTRFHLGDVAEKSEITTEMGKKCIGAALCH
ncbi:ribosome biogenesis protein [Prevotella sp. HUN102]|uniref:ribosome biogenesis protein n=1 Tax=Prevotella sp. HUN102 TaxID=1392486 RepID=UPI0009DD89A3|nr:ribosome biogenesis protein [Prevotella sp. HUN102]